ncbi:hypothetical protein [Methylobacterium sp. yr668]|uniref:hypothetical protein n=1 Tax=Methylobacterium sp. yr668 TaxID=1761801 RepID=UPI0008EC9DD5|nr:hypothetical protein [Methylobacterium sp. yr668]SFT11656.1 hypothetical protein SAMN04487845_11715 [Methylobacterium sp. yr668]
MFRSTLAAVLAAAMGAIAVRPVEVACADALLPRPELVAVGLVSVVAGLLWLFVMLCREPKPARRVSLTCPRGRPAPPSAASGVKPPRDAAGRFKGR